MLSFTARTFFPLHFLFPQALLIHFKTFISTQDQSSHISIFLKVFSYYLILTFKIRHIVNKKTLMENESLSLYDNRLQNKEINILKTILPYLGSTAQKNISMMISYLQMQKTMEYFENPENTMQISAMEKKNSTSDILNAIKIYCNDNEKRQIDQVLNAMQMLSTYEILFNGGND